WTMSLPSGSVCVEVRRCEVGCCVPISVVPKSLGTPQYVFLEFWGGRRRRLEPSRRLPWLRGAGTAILPSPRESRRPLHSAPIPSGPYPYVPPAAASSTAIRATLVSGGHMPHLPQHRH